MCVVVFVWFDKMQVMKKHRSGESVDGATQLLKGGLVRGNTWELRHLLSRRQKPWKTCRIGTTTTSPKSNLKNRIWCNQFPGQIEMWCHITKCEKQGSPSYFWEFEVSQIVKFTQINARLQVIGRMMMEKLLFQERILIHRHCFWWIWSLVVLSILVRWRRDLPVKMWRRWLTNGTRENSKKNLAWKGRHYAESEGDIAIIAGIALHSWHSAFLWGVRYSVSVINIISITANSNVNIKHDSH